MNVLFWLIGAYNPIRWSSVFLKADYKHVYVPAFYAACFVLGTLAKVPKPGSLARAGVLGAAVGMASSVVAILMVDLSRTTSAGVELGRMIHDGALTVIAVWSGYSVILGAPFWGALVAIACQILNRWKHGQLRNPTVS